MKPSIAKLEPAKGGLIAIVIRAAIVAQALTRKLFRSPAPPIHRVVVVKEKLPVPSGWVDVAEGRMLAARCKDSQRIDFKHLVSVGPILPSVGFRIRMTSVKSTRPQIHRQPPADQ